MHARPFPGNWLILLGLILAGLPSARAQPTNTVDTRVAEIVQDWNDLPGIFDDIEIYSRQVRELVQIGKPAVPALAAALDRTDRDTALRLLGFTLRAIGDPRAVPALVRAIPKTLRPPGSDCGMSVNDPELLAFMAKNDLDDGRGRGFSMGRPVREICVALGKITGTNQHDSEIFLTFLNGGERQRAMQRRQYDKVARRWVDWWHDNWQRYVQDPALAEIRLPAFLEKVDAGLFLTGSNVKWTYGTGSDTVGAVTEGGRDCFLDLNLGRTLSLPEKLSQPNAPPVSIELASAWAAQAGADLLGTQYKDPASGKMYYCVRGISLQAWEISNDRWDTISNEISGSAPLALGQPAGDLLMHYDAAQARYVPARKATFLFITREGTQGILRVVAQVTRPMRRQPTGMFAFSHEDTGPNQASESGSPPGVEVQYRFFYAETESMKAQEQARRDEAAAIQAKHRRKLAAELANKPHLTGKVYLPDGSAASNAAVVILKKRETVLFFDRGFPSEEFLNIAFTEADGSFSLPEVSDAEVIDAAHNDGFAVLDLAKSKSPSEIHLEPWGRIEGTMLLEGKSGAHQKLDLHQGFSSPGHLVFGTISATSDDQGRFVFTNLPPGEVTISRSIHDSLYAQQYFTVIAGKTTVIQHGFHGRTLTGHFAMPDATNAINWNGGWGFRLLSKLPPPPPLPKDANPRTWWIDFQSSPEGIARQRASKSFAISVEANGDFKIEDVPAGPYELDVQLRETPGFFGTEIARLTNDLTVPEFSPAEEDRPLDLGTLTLEKTPPAVEIQERKPGDIAPDFQVKTVDGGSLRLADFRGKYVLLDFWATWCLPCRREMPNLKAVYDFFGTNQQFAMVSLSLDKTMEAPRDYAKTNHFGWHQGFLGDWAKTTLPAQYGVDGIPSVFLINPSGKIVATDLRGDDIASAVANALARK
jgi:peroxiredoxin